MRTSHPHVCAQTAGSSPLVGGQAAADRHGAPALVCPASTPCARVRDSLVPSPPPGSGHNAAWLVGHSRRGMSRKNRTQFTPAPSASRSVRADPVERHETPDPVRSDAVEPRFHCVRQRTDLHDQHKLSSIGSGQTSAAAGFTSPAGGSQVESQLSPRRHRHDQRVSQHQTTTRCRIRCNLSVAAGILAPAGAEPRYLRDADQQLIGGFRS